MWSLVGKVVSHAVQVNNSDTPIFVYWDGTIQSINDKWCEWEFTDKKGRNLEKKVGSTHTIMCVNSFVHWRYYLYIIFMPWRYYLLCIKYYYFHIISCILWTRYFRGERPIQKLRIFSDTAFNKFVCLLKCSFNLSRLILLYVL